MSYSFYLPHVKKLFSSQKVLTVKELLDLVPRLKQFSIPHDRKDFDFDAFHAKRLDEMDSLLVAIIGISARGVELSMADFEGKRCYRVRAFTPCSIDDWKLTLQLTEALSRKLGVRIKDEYGNEYTADTLNQVDYRHDILAG
ncbi:MAG: DUF4299 family protein, partial [Bacillota bacterium]|nr:DUF4299 family protein [Bacillota bacterium]